jgi:AmmeMemoRadiSam system protein A
MNEKKKEEYIKKIYNVSVEELFKIAKESIIHYLNNRKYPKFEDNSKKGASFVTLFKNKALRGCIGSILPVRPLKTDVSYNAINAAFFDPRFEPLSEEELKNNEKNFEIEISILTPLKKFEGNVKDWINFISKEKPGIFIKKGLYSATFLPDVWKELNDPFEFMNHLSLKAGLGVTDWVDSEKYYYYTFSFKKRWDQI